MKRNTLIFFIVCLIFPCFSQNNSIPIINSKALFLIGEKNRTNLFKGFKDDNIYKLEFDGKNFYASLFTDQIELKDKRLIYINNEIEIYGSEGYFILYYKGKRYEIKINKKYYGTEKLDFCLYKNYLICTLNGMNSLDDEFKGDNMRYVDLNNIQDSAVILPFYAEHAQTSGEWVYFSSLIYNEEYGTVSEWKIHRMKPGEWQPELLIEKSLKEGWFVHNEAPILYTSFSYNGKVIDVMYEINSNRFAELSPEITKELKLLNQVIYIYQINKFYYLKRESNYEKGTVKTFLIPLPEIPEEFPNEFK